MNIKQALVTCGGTGYRLKKAGMKFIYSKSFIECENHPIFHWCLLGLYYSGIERLVIIGDGNEKLKRAEKVLLDFPYSFSKVDFHKDPGLGSNGLPYQARRLLDEYFLFECGHSMSEPEHYEKLEKQLTDENIVVFSSFIPNHYAPRPRIKLEGNKIIPIHKLTGESNEFSVGSPRLLSQKYISKLPELNFDLYKIIEYYSSKDLLRLVQSNMPIEVDVIEEWNEAIPIYHKHISKLCNRVSASFKC